MLTFFLCNKVNYALTRVRDAEKSKRLLAQLQKQMVDLLHSSRAQLAQVTEELKTGWYLVSVSLSFSLLALLACALSVRVQDIDTPRH
jgi:hypothetical protein